MGLKHADGETIGFAHTMCINSSLRPWRAPGIFCTTSGWGGCLNMYFP
jgi:hypothetical protein